MKKRKKTMRWERGGSEIFSYSEPLKDGHIQRHRRSGRDSIKKTKTKQKTIALALRLSCGGPTKPWQYCLLWSSLGDFLFFLFFFLLFYFVAALLRIPLFIRMVSRSRTRYSHTPSAESLRDIVLSSMEPAVPTHCEQQSQHRVRAHSSLALLDKTHKAMCSYNNYFFINWKSIAGSDGVVSRRSRRPPYVCETKVAVDAAICFVCLFVCLFVSL